jgi:hypothetical protein
MPIDGSGQTVAGLDGLIAQAEQHLDELNTRRESRQRELELERHCSIADITHIGRPMVLPLRREAGAASGEGPGAAGVEAGNDGEALPDRGEQDRAGGWTSRRGFVILENVETAFSPEHPDHEYRDKSNGETTESVGGATAAGAGVH